jgi:hypothetical protein
MKEVFEAMRTEMTRAQAIQAKQADKLSCGGQVMKSRDFVWMDARNIMTQRPSKKLD